MIEVNKNGSVAKFYSREEIRIDYENYLKETRPYIEALASIQSLKPMRLKIDQSGNYGFLDYGEDSRLEKSAKSMIEYYKDKYLGKYEKIL